MVQTLAQTSGFVLLAMLTDQTLRRTSMKTRLLAIVLLLALLGLGAMVIGQTPGSAPPQARSTAQEEADLEEFIPSETVSFDSAISLPVDI